jgi:hypothetical protein
VINAGFELSSYEQILQSALRSGYEFLPFSNIGKESQPCSCLLRHDIDSELLGCDAMLDIERSLGVRATYFIMTRSTAYNLFSVEGVATVARILREGHSVGLHFMGERCEGRSVEHIVDEVLREKLWLEQEFGTTIEAVSFHQPTRLILDAQIVVPTLINTYNFSQLEQYFYVSDTNMIWRQEHPIEIFTRRIYPRLQLLIHPIWWTHAPLTTLDKWRNVLRLNRRVVIDHWRSRERTLVDANFD